MAGDLYGTTEAGGGTSCTYSGPGCGVIFKLTPSGTESVLYRMCGEYACADGANLAAGLISDGKTLYGAAEYGGSINCNNGCGTIFTLKK
jgi:uncharacterized repeat protein (TIGR03803 family)